MSFGMMKIEQDFLEVMVEYVPRIAQALEKIAEGAKDKETTEQPKKRRGRPPKVKKDIYTLAREKTAGRNA